MVKDNSDNCKPMIECQVVNPYHEKSVLSDSECTNVSGYSGTSMKREY